MSFGRLLETALAGSQRRQIAASSPENHLLRRASYEGLRRLAGRPLDPAQNVVARLACAPETLLPVPPRAEARLLHVVRDRPGLLEEWLGLVAGRKLRVSHDCLPDVLDHARAHPEIHSLILRVGGERLAWLAALNPDWHYAASVEVEEQFAHGTLEERVRAFARIRRHDAARGRELLQSVFDARSERAETRAALLSTLMDGLSTDDEPLLLRAVQDVRKELREKGLRLIRRIPASRFGRRWSERARQLVTLTETTLGTEIEIREPEVTDPTWVLDGLDPRPPKGIGPTAWVLQQLIALAPPSTWPHSALQGFARSDWSLPLLSGLAQAAVAYADVDWCEVLVAAGANAEIVRGVHPTAVLGVLPPDRAEAVVDRMLSARANAVATLAASLRHAWSQDFSQVILRHLPDLLGTQPQAASALVQEAPLRLDPTVLAQAEQLRDDPAGPVWARPALQRLVSTLEFRLAMRKELDPL